MLNKIDHIAIVVGSIEEALNKYSKLFGFKAGEAYDEPSGEFKTMLINAEGITIELLQPVNPEGAIAKFFAKNGESIHHVSFNVSDVKEEMETLKANGTRLTTEEPMKVSTTQVTYVHPKSTGGVLIELIQR